MNPLSHIRFRTPHEGSFNTVIFGKMVSVNFTTSFPYTVSSECIENAYNEAVAIEEKRILEEVEELENCCELEQPRTKRRI